MKLYRLFNCLTALISSLALYSCTTASLTVPGEDSERVSSIYREYYSIAQSYEDLKNYTKAITYYKMAMEDSDLKEAAYYKTGRCYAMAKDWANALNIYEDLLKKDPQNVTLILSNAYIHAMMGNLEEASSLYEKLLQTEKDASLYKNYLSVLLAAEKYDRAKEILELFRTDFPADENIKLFSEKIEAKEKADAKPEEAKPNPSESEKKTEESASKTDAL